MVLTYACSITVRSALSAEIHLLHAYALQTSLSKTHSTGRALDVASKRLLDARLMSIVPVAGRSIPEMPQSRTTEGQRPWMGKTKVFPLNRRRHGRLPVLRGFSKVKADLFCLWQVLLPEDRGYGKGRRMTEARASRKGEEVWQNTLKYLKMRTER